MLKIAVVTSGRGTLLRYVFSACFDGVLDGEVVAVGTNRECPALDVANQVGIKHVAAYPIDSFASRAERDARMAEDLVAAGADFVLVGGYSEVLEDAFLDHFRDRAISVYPTILPSFGDLDEAIGPALNYGVKTLGLTIHFRDPLSLSDGPIIAQIPIAVDVGDTIQSVTPKIAAVERQYLPLIMQAFAEGRIVRDGRLVSVLDVKPDAA
ncbi:MAG: phosphoribosylglycinamide formyltransferase 1 [Pseudonocardiales bacterium]|jgi:phosphoribosylglycinamide formyltransferase-1|nr:phosphoribosylglycinamide formyltransferase 1 [Pseudonocardiales bacterium]